MSRRFSLQILLPIQGYDEDKIYKREDIKLREEYLNQKLDDVYYRRLKEKSIYASMEDVIEFVKYKYSLEQINGYSIRTNHLGEYEINIRGNKYIVTKEEIKQLEKEHINESIYCNEFKYCSLSWFYTSIGNELISEDITIVDDALIQKASLLLGYELEKNLAEGLADVIEDDANGEDKFMASLILAKEIANRVNGRAVLRYE